MHQKLYSKLVDKLDSTRSTINSFSKNAPNKYKVYTIPKRTSGHRVIAHPSKELKKYQRALVSILSDILNIHPTSYAYRTGFSIKDNAYKHRKNQYLLKMDFSDFFNSIEPKLLFFVFDECEIHFSSSELRLLEKLLFWNKNKSVDAKLALSVGAPSSPLISNFIMCIFDEKINYFCEKNGITYTRYADDLTFSSNKKNILFNVPNIVKNLLKEEYKNLILVNDLKTCFSSKAHNRHITGVTINNDAELSIGRDRKRLISAMINNYKKGILLSEDFDYLRGILSFANNIEPDFISRMKRKYGKCILLKIKKGLPNE
ncbi:RNA-directed DNA polymerase [Photobacterium carnosum]|nr:RNA-directed DNA polymerase [Photobacterium carnosum]